MVVVSLLNGTVLFLADLIRYIALLPAAEQGQYVVERSGDHRLTTEEVLELYARADFPHA